MSDYDWSRFKRSIFIKAKPERVFEAWSRPEQIATWFLRRADFTTSDGTAREPSQRIEAGDNYSWNWWNYEGTEEGQVTRVNASERHLEFTFAGDCTVIVDVEVKDGDTLLRLEQIDIPLDEKSKREIHMGCGQGWAFWMVNLKSWLEHEVLLHDRESHHKNKDYGFCELINR
jgi:uncharacterized protein YndB with AHSA1/START domain